MIKVPKASEGALPPISSKPLRDNKKKTTSLSSAEKKESSNFSCRSWSEKAWYAKFKRLAEFHRIHGTTTVPAKYPPDPKLGTWVRTQRHQYQCMQEGKTSHMNKERIQLLEELAFQWSMSENGWHAQFKRLAEFHRIHGTTSVTGNYPPDPKLGHWVRNQRHQYQLMQEGKTSSMNKERIQLLEGLAFRWSIYKENWSENGWHAQFNRLAEFHRIHGTAVVPVKYPPDPKLGNWVAKQRYQYQCMQKGKTSTMNKERIQLLEGLAFRWSLCKNTSEKVWYVQFKRLAEFHRIQGTTTVPVKYPPDQKLGNWVMTQRRQYQRMQKGKTSTMNKERIQLLEGLAFRWVCVKIPK